MSNYPELERLQSVQSESETCGDFLHWLMTKYSMFRKSDPRDNMYVSVGSSDYINIESVLAEYFDIDMQQVELEKEMLLREAVGK